MTESNVYDERQILGKIQEQARTKNFRLSIHGQQEMVDENIVLADVTEAVNTAQILENYPEHKRGACCLLYGITSAGRPLHVVCTTSLQILVIIAVYEPKPPRWLTPTQRGGKA